MSNACFAEMENACRIRTDFGRIQGSGEWNAGKISIGASLLDFFSLHHQKAITTKWLVNQIFLVVHVAG